MKSILLILTFLFTLPLLAGDTLKLLFVYGSRPKAKHENRWFGGIHGGHVSINYGKYGYASFAPNGSVHVFSKRNINSTVVFETENSFLFDTTDSRYMIISIPIDSCKRAKLDSVIVKRVEKCRYDYAFFGMRCASSAYEMCAVAGIFPLLSDRVIWRKYFYPKLLRKELLKKAKSNSWPIYYRKGRDTRKWEKD